MERSEFLRNVKLRVITSVLGDDELFDMLVLKGGNLLQFALEISSRASQDIDISIDGDIKDFEWLKGRVRSCLNKSFAEIRLVVFDFKFEEKPSIVSEEIKSFWGGYQCEFKLVESKKHADADGDVEQLRKQAQTLNSSSNSTKFKIDFSRAEFCDDKQEFEIDGYTIFGYSPRLFAAEKLRAICQQMDEYKPVVHRQKRASASRARDFVDLWVVRNEYGIDAADSGFQDVVRKVFIAKRVPLELLGKIKDCKEQHEDDFVAVRATVATDFDLQSFEFYFDYVCEMCRDLEPIWNE